MRRVPYTADVSHCPGARARLCARCYRYLLMREWERRPAEQRGAILLLPARMEKVRCESFYDVQRVI